MSKNIIETKDELKRGEINSKLSPRGITMVGPIVKNSTTTKTDFMCEHGHQWSSTLNNVLNVGRGCPHCSNHSPLSKKEINERLFDRKIEIIGEYNGTHSKTEFQCKHGHRWVTVPNKVINAGTGCPECARHGRAGMSPVEIEEALSQRNITMVGTYINTTTKTDFVCEHGHQWSATLNNVIGHNSGCPGCADHGGGGFNPAKPGHLYVIDFKLFIKYGITNDLQRRLKEHQKNGVHRVISTQLFEDGSKARDLERKIKSMIGSRHATKEQCPDGYTETLCPSKLSELMAIIDQSI